jgi:DMSO/TMAO reductase YedYZ molybdopterin-dependent catalytic subunit
VFRSKAEQKVADAGYDPARLPPGQYLTEKVAGAARGRRARDRPRELGLQGLRRVENPITLSWEQCRSCRRARITIDIHCVTRWSRFDTSFRGVHWRDLAELVKPKPSARFVVAHAEQGFTSNVPLEALEDEQAMIAYEADGEPLEPEHGWPLRLVVPAATSGRARSGCGSRATRPRRAGFWERYGYHNDADYWQEQRYAF